MTTFEIIFTIIMVFVFGTNAYTCYMQSREVKQKPILTNNSKRSIQGTLIITSILWTSFAICSIVELIKDF